jgi:hypothetical protein
MAQPPCENSRTVSLLVQFLRHEEIIPLAEVGLAFTVHTDLGHRQFDESHHVSVETVEHIATIFRLVNLGFVQKEVE